MGQSHATRDSGHEFSKYRLREPLSESFLGTRYRAVSTVGANLRAASNAFGTDLSSWRSSAFALRLIRAQTPTLVARVARAAKAVRHLDHPNVLAPIQLIRAQTKLGVITQDVDGVTLSELLRLAAARGEALPQSVALCIAGDVIEGLVALHASEGDVQRYEYACGGLTPDSIHVGSDGHARLIDPGVAGAAASVPFWGHDPVALAYTAPEQTGAEPRFNPGSDAFSIGAIVWEMLAGRSLFGDGPATETLERVHRAPIPRVQRRQFVRGEPIAARVAYVVGRALQREPSHRYHDCGELGHALLETGEAGAADQVAAYYRRLTSRSAGAFSDAPLSAALGNDFEVVTGSMSRLDSVPAPSAAPSQPPLAAESFEPHTARISTSTPAPAPETLRPPALPADPDGPAMSAFPISDLLPAKATPWRNHHLRLAAAAVVLLAVGALAWRGASGASERADSPPMAASRPAAPAAAPPAPTRSAAPSVAAPREAPTPTVSPDPTVAPVLPDASATPPPPKAAGPVHSGGTRRERSEAGATPAKRRPVPRPELKIEPAADPPESSDKFIPDDI